MTDPYCSLHLRVITEAGFKVDKDHVCCQRVRNGVTKWPNVTGAKDFGCIDFASSVISCGYLLNKDKKSADKVLMHSKQGEAMIKNALIPLKWNTLFYAADILNIQHPWKRGRLNIPWQIRQVSGTGTFHGITPVGSVTHLSPWPDSADPGDAGVQDAALTALEAEKFGVIVATDSHHVALLHSNKVSECPHPSTTDGIANWVGTQRAKFAQSGWIVLPPSDGGLDPYKEDLKFFRRRRYFPDATDSDDKPDN